MNDIKCPFCDRTFGKLGIKAHIWQAHTEQGQKWREKQAIRIRIVSEETKRKISEKAKARLKKDLVKLRFCSIIHVNRVIPKNILKIF